MPTIKQELSFKKLVEKVGNHKPTTIGRIMRQCGYSDSMAKNPQKLTKSKGWEFLLSKIDDNKILAKVYEIAMGKDKRAALAAAIEIFKLKSRYPKPDIEQFSAGDVVIKFGPKKEPESPGEEKEETNS